MCSLPGVVRFLRTPKTAVETCRLLNERTNERTPFLTAPRACQYRAPAASQSLQRNPCGTTLSSPPSLCATHKLLWPPPPAPVFGSCGT